jgi:hypothetical protein
LVAIVESDPVLGFVLVLSEAVLVLGLARWLITSYEYEDDDEDETQTSII